MYDCSNDILAYHDERVTLPDPERTEMRNRRDSNRDKAWRGLEREGDPTPIEFRSQGSYAMRTMVQHPSKDYDIDDGVYFWKEDLVDEKGRELSARQVKEMVRDAVDDGNLSTPPEVRRNCVRVQYAKGYHVDIPCYRRVTTKDWLGNESHHHELAGPTWKRSDARDVTGWFKSENEAQSPDTSNGRQLRRVTREIKMFARSRAGWSGKILSGFGITKLVTETYRAHATREDVALYDTMRAMRDRLEVNLVVDHPVTPAETITTQGPDGSGDPKAAYLRDRLSEALDDLASLNEADCTRERALATWDRAFATTFFGARKEPAKVAAGVATPSVLSSGFWADREAAAASAVRKEGGGRHA
ncbi:MULTISPECIES: cyclic GMP-AMP synthase DncV-like nucleotidyltransferase [unclassified Aureimonas]|uniref:cyclic GMP-AMP synthase DncV-like nucleotidyltransferase n=1 Tax=unclassified Aureimonas TaxID=2615206 RepID=UPI0006F3297E|nr:MULTISPECIES: hypothetical protein [unclassified Aureimonas]KQT60569.1 hypothetical protein ASG62_08000 [Aureimonas sp. Leaf427]KQT79500.1 hypothetical protein ASG54_10600 [Aureimonas sp. Leaf460]